MGDSRAVLRSVFHFWELRAPVVVAFCCCRQAGEMEQKKDRQALAQAALRYLEIARPLLISVLYSAQQPAAIREMRSLGPRTTWVVELLS